MNLYFERYKKSLITRNRVNQAFQMTPNDKREAYPV